MIGKRWAFNQLTNKFNYIYFTFNFNHETEHPDPIAAGIFIHSGLYELTTPDRPNKLLIDAPIPQWSRWLYLRLVGAMASRFLWHKGINSAQFHTSKLGFWQHRTRKPKSSMRNLARLAGRTDIPHCLLGAMVLLTAMDATNVFTSIKFYCRNRRTVWRKVIL